MDFIKEKGRIKKKSEKESKQLHILFKLGSQEQREDPRHSGTWI